MDVDKSDKLIRLLDTVVIKLEGGTEEDLKVLDEPPTSEQPNIEKQGYLFVTRLNYYAFCLLCILFCMSSAK